MISILTNTVTLDIGLVLSILSILVILASAIMFMVNIATKTTKVLTSMDNSINNLTNEVVELKGYRVDIDENTKAIINNQTEIKLIKQRCEYSLAGKVE